MTIGADVRDETRAFNEQLRQVLAAQPPLETVPPADARRARYEGRSVFPPPVFLPQADWVDVPARSAALRARVLRPAGDATGVYLHLHGGGWTLGAADLQDVLLAQLARESGLVVASLEYRLAPEHPYPAAPDDCAAGAAQTAAEGTGANCRILWFGTEPGRSRILPQPHGRRAGLVSSPGPIRRADAPG